jgi:hypothetical protein
MYIIIIYLIISLNDQIIQRMSITLTPPLYDTLVLHFPQFKNIIDSGKARIAYDIALNVII